MAPDDDDDHDDHDQLDETAPPRIERMLSVGPATGAPVWEPEELAAILRHQLDAPVEPDDDDLDAATEPREVVTFGELLRQPRPALSTIERAKRFAKACKNDPFGPLPKQVATVIYFMCILAARLRCDSAAKVSTLDDAALLEGIDWIRAQAWADVPPIPELCAAAITHLNKGA